MTFQRQHLPQSPAPAWLGSHGHPTRHPTTPPGPQGLTFIVTARRVVEGQAQGDYGCDFQDDQRDVLECLPH